jgi:hypothetical protein
MTHEGLDSPDQKSQEHQQDRNWIDENRALLWLAATVAFEEIGYGFLVVDLTKKKEDHGHPFAYYSEDELEPEQDEDGNLLRLLKEYDPDREFIVMLWKGEGHRDVYLDKRPPAGWYVDMRTQTRYGKQWGESEKA